ncbi:MAG: hypothetical protein HOP28_00670 [Gemmatimonadales bacterium]|nr:hypothetical protein [Gemmatimonadales bacterium]
MRPLRFAAALVAALLPSPAAAQDMPVIKGIEIRRFNIFAPEEAGTFIPRLANSLHRTTRTGVVRRELLFRPGMPFDPAAIAESGRNLRRLGVFRSVALDSVHSDSGLVVRVVTADGWTTRPDFRFSSVGRTIQYTVQLEESNLLGTATYLAVRYRKLTDRTLVSTSFQQPRLFAGRIGATAVYEDRSDGSRGFLRLSRPFFSLSQRSSWQVDGEFRDERVLRFFGGDTLPGASLLRKYALGYAAYGWALRAGPAGYVRVGVNAQLRRDDFADYAVPDTIGRTTSGAIGGFAQVRWAHFLVSRGLEGYAREQDIDVSTVISFGVFVTPKAFGYREDGIAPSVSVTTGFGRPTGFVQLFGRAAGRFTSAGLDSGSVQVAATAFLQPGRRHLVALHGITGWQEGALPGAEFDLGFGIGPRGYYAHAFTGDRAFFTTAEYRWTAFDDFLKLTALGIAGFVDYGGAWYHGSKRRTGWDAGIGLRIGLTRTGNVETNRLDLVYRQENEWQEAGWTFVVAKGFAFSLNGRFDQ